MNKVNGKIEICADRLICGDYSEKAAFIEELFDIYDSMFYKIDGYKQANEEAKAPCEVDVRNSRIDADYLIIEFIKDYIKNL